MTTATLRLEAQLTDTASVQQVERLQAVLGAGNADLLRSALQLMDWCVSQVRQGRQIASVSDSGSVVREFSMPLFERARAHGRLLVSTDAFDQMTHLVENPPAPTAALRKLMSSDRAKGR
jgi:hypothetical protein